MPRMGHLKIKLCRSETGLKQFSSHKSNTRLLALYLIHILGCIYYYIVIDIYLKIISIIYFKHISEYIVYIKNKSIGK